MSDLYENGLKAYRKGLYERARELLHEEVENNDQNHEAWNVLGLCLSELGLNDDAIICLENALILSPNNDDYKNTLQIIKKKSKKWYKFSIPSIYKKLIWIIVLAILLILAYFFLFAPPSEEKYIEMGNKLLNEGKYEDAIEAFDNAININHNNSDIWNSKGVALHKNKNYSDAVVAYNNAIQLNLSNFASWHNKGVSLYELGRIEDAINAYDQALKLNPNHEISIDAKKIALVKITPIPTQKITSLPTSTPLPTDDPKTVLQSLMFEANKRINYRDYGEAIQLYDQALQIAPNDANIWIIKGNALYENGYYDEASIAYQQAQKNSGISSYGISLNNRDYEKYLKYRKGSPKTTYQPAQIIQTTVKQPTQVVYYPQTQSYEDQSSQFYEYQQQQQREFERQQAQKEFEAKQLRQQQKEKCEDECRRNKNFCENTCESQYGWGYVDPKYQIPDAENQKRYCKERCNLNCDSCYLSCG